MKKHGTRKLLLRNYKMIKNGIYNFYSNRNVNEIKKKRSKRGKNEDNEFNNRCEFCIFHTSFGVEKLTINKKLKR